MAKLEEIASNLNVDIKPSKLKKKPVNIGKKRRAWFSEDIQESKKKSHENQIGSINQIDEHGLSIQLINRIDKLDYPNRQIGSINQIDKQGYIELEHLRGNPLKMIKLICGLIGNTKEKITEKFTLNEIAAKLNISKDSAKTAIKFLIKNNLIFRKDFQSGKNGWSQYLVEDSIYEKVIQIGFINPVLKGSNSSSSILNTTTTIRPDKQFGCMDTIDQSLLKKIGLTENHLKQLCNASSFEIIQNSINHFVYDLEHNEKMKEIKKTPLDYFMGIMKRNGCYNAPDNYESSQDKAIREWVEKEEKQKKLREEQRMKIFNLSFDKWLDSLTEEEARKIFHDENLNSRIPFKGKGDSGFSQAMLRNYYRKKIWINERKELGLDGFWDHFNEDSLDNVTNG